MNPARISKSDRIARHSARLEYVRQCLALVCLVFVMFGVATPAEAAKRLALVIGNSEYQKWPLVNPVNDAHAVAKKLKTLNFEVTVELQLKRDDIGVVTDQFLRKISPSDTVVFFYAGHGVQVGGQNFLLATDAVIRSEYDVHRNGIDFTRFLRRLDRTRAAVKLVFLDACRNNPFAEKLRGGADGGLARVGGAPYGTLISFATQPGGVAADGEGKHGLYTEQLLAHIDSPGVPVEQMLKKVAASTHRASNGKQRPWVEGSLYGDFVFSTAPLKPVAPAIVAKVQPSTDYARLAWGFAIEADTVTGYKAFLREYSDSAYAALARIKIATLSNASGSAAQAKTKPIEVAALSGGSLGGSTADAAPTVKPAPVVKQAPVISKAPIVKKAPVVASRPPARKEVVVKPKQEKRVVRPTTRASRVVPVNTVATKAAPPPKSAPVQVARAKTSILNKPSSSAANQWDLARLEGKVITSAQGAPFEAEFKVSGNRLVVRRLRWVSLPGDAEGGFNESLRCGIFSNTLRLNPDGSVSGSCSAGHVTATISGRIDQLNVTASYLAPGGISDQQGIVVPMQAPLPL